MMNETTTEDFFEQKYKESPDPWEFASSPYELHRYSITIEAIRGRHFLRAFEPGCSIGVLTAQLAKHCGSLLAMDISATAVAQARERCQNWGNVEIIQGGLEDDIPESVFDLIVLSEIGYYFSSEQLRNIGSELILHLQPNGILLAVHWLGTSRDHLLSGDAVHEIFMGLDGLVLEHSERHTGFRLDRWRRT